MNSSKYPYQDSELSPKERATDLLSRMSQEEKLGQIQCYSQINSGGRPVEEAYPHGVGEVSSLIATMYPNKESVAEMVRQMQQKIMGQSAHHIPAIFHIETLCGTMIAEAASFPSGIGQASTWNPKIQKEMGRVIGRQTRAAGFSQALAPVLDISRDPRFGRQGESYGEDPTLAAAMGTAYIQGLQNDGDLTYATGAVAKHFLGFQAGEGGIHSARTSVTERELREVYAKPFQAAITEGGLNGVMNSYAAVNREPVCGSKKILTELLRNEMGFEGMTVSDYDSITQLASVYHVCEDEADAGQRALEAGMDSELPGTKCYTEKILERIEVEEMDGAILDRAVLHILTEKFRLGLFENPYPADHMTLQQVFRDDYSKEVSRKMAGESMILLKNTGILPLKTERKKIAVIGCHGASTRTFFGGYTYMAMKENSVGVQMTMAGIELDSDAPSAAGEAAECYPGSQVRREHPKVEGMVRACYPGIKSLYEELKEKCQDAEVVYAYGYPYAGDDERYFSEALETAAMADVLILTLGGHYGWNMSSTMGEGIDSMNIGIPECQEKFIRKAAELGKPMIGVHFDGRPISSDAADQYLDALLETWTPGEYGAQAIADILTGKENPGGKLPVCVAREAGQIPVYYSHENGSSYDTSESAAFQDYVDGSRRPRYSFGYGLSYTKFSVDNMRIDLETVDPDECLTILADVANTGNYKGSEVVQLYIKDCCAQMVRPVMELAGFQKVELKPGEKKTVRFKLFISQTAFLDETMRWKVEKGTIQLLLGTSSTDIREEKRIQVAEDKYVDGAKRRFFTCSEVIA